MVELELSVDVDEPMNSGLEAQGRGGLSTYIDVEIDPEDGGPRRVVQVSRRFSLQRSGNAL